MNQEFLNQLEQWNEESRFQEIIDAIEALPQEELTAQLISDLACAYNNSADAGNNRLQHALDLLLPLERELGQEHTWNFRVGYAYYYLDQEGSALGYFERALEACPGDKETQYFINECRNTLALPISIKPFRARTLEGWASFWNGEKELRRLLDREDRAAVSEQLVAKCSELLAPAFRNPAFELGHNGETYELILSPEGDRTRMFQLAYFQKRAPKELLQTWSVKVGRSRSEQFVLRMCGQNVSLADVQAWVEKTENHGLGLRLYCEKLASQKKENEGQVYSILCILLDQALGELAAMRYVDYLDILDTPAEGESIPLNQLAGFVAAEVDPEGWPMANDPELAGERYTAYRGEPSLEGNWDLRRDVFAGVTSCVPILKGYLQGDGYYMDRLHQDGVVPGFFYYALDGVAKEEVLDLRDRLEEAILKRAGADAVTFTGGATGSANGYLDFIAWDLKAVLDAAVEVFAQAPVKQAAFHTFRGNVWSIILKQEEAQEQHGGSII